MSEKILGLIAGNGQFPILFAQQARSQGYHVVAMGIKGDTSFFLRFFVNELQMFWASDLKKSFEYLRSRGVRQVIMAGQVSQKNLFNPSVPYDEEIQKLFQTMTDRKADTIFSAIGNKLSEYGMTLMDSTALIKDYLAPKGTLTRRGPTQTELTDIGFGRDLAKQMGGMDVGQTVVVKEKAIVAIEAMEGTDKTILRGGHISRRGAVVVKMSKPKQDSRFDVPVIGPRTVQNMIKSKCCCLAIESGKTIIIDRERTIKLANKHGISIISS
ncbi:MAG: UDP-2,3-diacylglucosamine diphosphatase LpxI [Candidatus Omnitrophica bacterium]|nr:UDP-2,3-diacylglucosamine diphosphatase LpxI [Candidatus Omnitrophota bacterium]